MTTLDDQTRRPKKDYYDLLCGNFDCPTRRLGTVDGRLFRLHVSQLPDGEVWYCHTCQPRRLQPSNPLGCKSKSGFRLRSTYSYCAPGWRCEYHAAMKVRGHPDPASEAIVLLVYTSVTKTADKSAGQRGCENPDLVNPAPTIPSLRNRHENGHTEAHSTCRNGHLMTAANTVVRADGYRECKRCGADRARQYRQRTKR